MTVALQSPRLLGAIIAVDNAPVDANLKNDFHQYVRGLREIEEAGISKQVEADHMLSKYEIALPVRQFLLTNLIRSPQEQSLRLRIPIKILASSLDNMGDFPITDPDKYRYHGPALVIRGTQSHYVPDDVLPLIGRYFPKFEVYDIDCGHWVISERPEAFRQ
ncbi:hypothetical protein ACLMJK_009609, partial [Lecanora helva]